jgi:cation:H+ antiporter
MALATSIPELFVGISSALSNVPSISLGNVIGASILNLTLIMGIFILVGGGIKMNNGKVGKDIYYVLFSIILLITLFLIGQSLSRIDGLILLAFFVLNSYRMFQKRRKYEAKLRENNIKRLEIVLNVVIFMIALVALFLSSGYAVKYASLLAIDFQLPEIIIGLFLLSIATTLPELILGVRAIKLGHKEMAIGDQTGTVLANIALIVGIVALISPIKAEFTPFFVSSIFLLISTFIFITFLKSEKELKIGEGIGLILLYVFFMIVQFLMKP